MATASLSNFTVPLASDQSASTQGLLMPKLQYRFRLSFTNFGVTTGNVTELTKQVQDAQRPTVEMEDQVIDIYNSRIHYAGKYKWSPVVVKIRDNATGEVTSMVGEQMQKQFDFFEQSSAASAGDYKFQLEIDMLDGGNGSFTPNVLESWTLYGCYLQKVNYGAIAYKTNEPVVLELSIVFDNAVQTAGGTFGASTPVMAFPGKNQATS
jgi:hypothetical protein